MTNAIEDINQDVVHPAAHNNDEMLEQEDLIELPAKRLPFSYARRVGALLSKHKDNRVVYYRGELDIDVLLEVRRIAGHGFTLEQLEDDKFELLLEASYQRDSSETQQMMEDIGNEVDLFSLADELPQTEDLLAGDDDAPIIKLINAMLS